MQLQLLLLLSLLQLKLSGTVLLHYSLLLVLLLLQKSSLFCCYCIFCCWGSSNCYCYSLSFRLCSISASFDYCVCYTATVMFFYVATFSLPVVFQVGSVPVYQGAPNVADYLPTPSSAVLASSFPSARSLADRLLQLDGDDLAYKRLLAHKRKYASADGRPISNKRLSESVAKRRWGVAEKDQMRLGSHVERFECLVCQRMREREAVRRAGFKEEEPWQAREEHYGCPYPKGPPWGEEKTKGTNQWQRMYAEGFARAVFLAARLGAGEKVLRGEVDKFLLRKEVALVVEGVIRREGDKEALKVYEKELRDLMGKQA